MSGWAAQEPLNFSYRRVAKFFVALGLLVAASFVGAASVRAEQSTIQLPGGLDDVDDRPPLPATEPKRAMVAARYSIPNQERRIFRGLKDPRTGKLEGGIIDFEPVASEKRNADEYFAWTEVIQHARKFTASELEEHAGRDLSWDDLIGPPRYLYRLDLLRFDGKLIRVRWVPGTASLERAGTAKVYEAQLVPLDEPMPSDKDRDKPWPFVVSMIFTELPESLAAVNQKAAGDWLTVDEWATAAGYSFKVKQDGPKDDPIPILIGKSVTILKGSPDAATSASNANNPTALDKNLRVFKFIKDDARLASGDENQEEAVSWNRVLLHARRFSPETLEANARSDVRFADLFEPVRRDYKLQLVKFEGRLIMLGKMEPSKKLLAAGLDAAYEGWLVPKDEPSGNPLTIVFTDPPEDVEPTTGRHRVNKWVSFAGYSFKLMRYESGERDKKDPNKYVIKRAPLLLGRAIVVRPDPDAPSAVSWTAFTQVAVAVILGLLGTAIGLTWWFRRGDKRARQEIDSHRGQNPFGN